MNRSAPRPNTIQFWKKQVPNWKDGLASLLKYGEVSVPDYLNLKIVGKRVAGVLDSHLCWNDRLYLRVVKTDCNTVYFHHMQEYPRHNVSGQFERVNGILKQSSLDKLRDSYVPEVQRIISLDDIEVEADLNARLSLHQFFTLSFSAEYDAVSELIRTARELGVGVVSYQRVSGPGKRAIEDCTEPF